MKKKLFLLFTIAILVITGFSLTLGTSPTAAFAAGSTTLNFDPACAGDRIIRTYPTPQGGGTIAAPAMCNTTGRLGVLTNEHVIEYGNAALLSHMQHKDFNLSVTAHMGGGFDPDFRWENSTPNTTATVDAAFVPFADGDAWDFLPHSRYMENIPRQEYGVLYNVRLGVSNIKDYIAEAKVEYDTNGTNNIVKVGQYTNETLGHITATSVNYSGKTDCFTYSNAHQGGDSGGPVYYKTKDENNVDVYYLIGIHMGNYSNGDGVACRIQNVINTLNVTPVTNDMFLTSDITSTYLQLDGIHSDFNILNGRLTVPERMITSTKIVRKIAANAFSALTQMTSVSIPALVDYIDPTAFDGCESLKSITFIQNAYSQDYFSKDGILYDKYNNIVHVPEAIEGDIEIPSGVTSIPAGAFLGRANFGGLTLPDTLTDIGDYAFLGAKGLQYNTITYNVQTPAEINATTFAGLDRSKIYVKIPAGRQGAFEAQGWTGFTFVQPGEEIVDGARYVLLGAGTPSPTATLTQFYGGISSLTIPATVPIDGTSEII
ncbi:MAG: leucine-rich repeat domain-containing protein [Firmicutes bacterium]|nr:leucine-rich repeat domain-containing protein [Bacillota bacterium]